MKGIPCPLLLVDANSLIYDVIHEGTYEGAQNDIKDKVFQKVLALISKTNASKSYVYFYGVVQYAKMKQQKQRRYKSYLTKQILGKKEWNTNAITPGTPFMRELDAYMKHACFEKNILFSGSDEEGEGEQKMFSYLRQNPQPCFVYGLDADLIMLSLLHGHLCPIHLYRETKYFSYLKDIQLNVDYVFDVHELALQVSECVGIRDTKKAVVNYCFLCFFCGNDFLPHFASIQLRNEGLPVLLDVYQSLGSKDLVHHREIQWDNVKELWIALSRIEMELIQKNIQWKMKLKTFANTPEERLNLYPLYDIPEKRLLIEPDAYYPFLIGSTPPSDLCKNYLKMLDWTLAYYYGDCKDYYYAYEFHMAPLFASLIHDLPCFNEPFEYTPSTPLSVNTQLLYVMPYSDYEAFIPEAYRNLSKEYRQLSLLNFPIETSFCKFFWECHVSFPWVPLAELNKRVLSL
jgi:5'-3' exonuclease